MKLKDCHDCPHKGCDLTTNFVPGVGPVPCDIMMVAEAPGRDEDKARVPLVGASGQKLRALAALIDLDMDKFYRTNVVKRRPTNAQGKNRKPLAREIKSCRGVLGLELAYVLPKIVVALGDTAAKWFDKSVGLKAMHGRARKCRVDLPGGGTWVGLVFYTYHPAAVMHNPMLQATMVQDWRNLREVLDKIDQPLLEREFELETDDSARVLCGQATTIGFDLETTSPKLAGKTIVELMQVVGWSMAIKELDCRDVGEHVYKGVYVPNVPSAFRGILEDPDVKIVCHNTKFEWKKLKENGIDLTNFEDTKIMAWLLQEPSSHLKNLASQRLHYDPITYKQVTGGRDMADIPPEEIVEYGVDDSINALALYGMLQAELQDAGLTELYRDVELPLIPVLGRMERHGIAVDISRAAQAEAEFKTLAGYWQIQAERELGGINLNSRDQLAPALEALGAPITERTDVKNLLKTDENTLVELAESGWRPQLMRALMQRAQFNKLAAFAAGFQTLRLHDGRLHPDFNQCGGDETAREDASESPPGRLSSAKPNMQQIPHHGRGAKGVDYEDHTRRLRSAIVAPDGYRLVAADFAQQEPRICAYVSGDPVLTADFAAGIPIYAPTGEIIYGRPIDKRADPSEWHVSKTFFLAYLYGADFRKLLDIDPYQTEARAKQVTAAIDNRYTRLLQWHGEVKREVRRTGMIVDWCGRRRLIPEAMSRNPYDRAKGYRKAINGHIQNVAATITKQVMLRAHADLVLPGIAELILPIHDEVVFEVPEANVQEVLTWLKTATEGLFPTPLPLEAQVGQNLGAMLEVPL